MSADPKTNSPASRLRTRHRSADRVRTVLTTVADRHPTTANGWPEMRARLDAGEGGEFPIGAAPDQRSPRTGRVLAAAAVVVVLVAIGAVVATTRSSDPASVEAGATSLGGGPSGEAPGASALRSSCDQYNVVDDAGAPINWESVAASFDPTGPFRLPARPSWVPVETYCSTVLTSSIATPPGAEPDPTGTNGPNRFVYKLAPSEGSAENTVLVNRIEITLYPTSVHDAFDRSGKRVGFFAPGVEFVDSDTFATAQQVADDPRVTAAVAAMVKECSSSSTSCDDVMRAATGAGAAARIGKPIHD